MIQGDKLNHNIVRKEFSGDMVGRFEAHIVSAYTGAPGSGCYVASSISRGREGSGTLVLQHSGILSKAEGGFCVKINPDSVAGELTGMSGTLDIDNSDGKHTYVLDYEKP